eukprot:1788444-Pleurochrysis_carterae.AAC.1
MGALGFLRLTSSIEDELLPYHTILRTGKRAVIRRLRVSVQPIRAPSYGTETASLRTTYTALFPMRSIDDYSNFQNISINRKQNCCCTDRQASFARAVTNYSLLGRDVCA